MLFRFNLCVTLLYFVEQNFVNGDPSTGKDLSKGLNKLGNALNAGCPNDAPVVRKGQSPNGDSPTEPIANMVRNAGYSLKSYEVTTKDGYILQMFRILKGSKKSKTKKSKDSTPVLIVHGLLSSPNDFLVNDKKKALPYKLVDSGRDVWLGANRGTSFSLRHKSMSTADPEFWKFSHVEYGLYDVPAFMDKIKSVTKEKQVYYIGHSLGTKQYFTLMSLFPGNCSRVKAMWALAPVSYLKHTSSPPVRLLAPLIAPLGIGTNLLGGLEFLPNNPAVKTATAGLCATKVGCPVCENFLYTLYGYDPKQVNTPWQSTQLGHAPDSTSVWNMIHQAQEVFFDRFGFIDLGPIDNEKKYGKKYMLEPPQFKPQNIGNNKQCKINMLYAEKDALTDEKDVKRLKKEMGSAVKSFTKINFKDWSHVDFIWAKDVDKYVNNIVLKQMDKTCPFFSILSMLNSDYLSGKYQNKRVCKRY